MKKAALVGKMRIQSMPLHVRLFGDHAQCRLRRSDRAVQLERRLGYPSAGFSLLLGAAL